MIQNEERLLKDYFDELSLEAGEVPEIKLIAAIRGGVYESKRRRMPAAGRYTLGGLAVLAIVLLFAFPSIGEHAELQKNTAQSPLSSAHDWGQFEVFRKAAGSNITVSSALDAGLIQAVNHTSVEQSGYVLTVDGISADQKGIIILYTLQSNSTKVEPYHLFVTDKEGKAVGQEAIWAEQKEKTGLTRGFEVFTWDRNYTELPNELVIKSSIQDKVLETKTYVQRVGTKAELSVPITLNQGLLAKTGETLSIDQTLSIAGQRLKIYDVYVAATGIYLEMEYNEHNSQEIYGLISARLMLGSGNNLTGLYSKRSYTLNGRQMLIFQNDITSREPLELRIDGINALDKNAKELVIDTIKEQIIKAPDDRLKVNVSTSGEGNNIMVIEVYPPAQKISASDSVNLILDENFTDGAGIAHKVNYDNIVINARKEDPTQKIKPGLYYYNIGKEALPQPLSFKISSYPNPIKEKVSLSIRK